MRHRSFHRHQCCKCWTYLQMLNISIYNYTYIIYVLKPTSFSRPCTSVLTVWQGDKTPWSGTCNNFHVDPPSGRLASLRILLAVLNPHRLLIYTAEWSGAYSSVVCSISLSDRSSRKLNPSLLASEPSAQADQFQLMENGYPIVSYHMFTSLFNCYEKALF